MCLQTRSPTQKAPKLLRSRLQFHSPVCQRGDGWMDGWRVRFQHETANRAPGRATTPPHQERLDELVSPDD